MGTLANLKENRQITEQCCLMLFQLSIAVEQLCKILMSGETR